MPRRGHVRLDLPHTWPTSCPDGWQTAADRACSTLAVRQHVSRWNGEPIHEENETMETVRSASGPFRGYSLGPTPPEDDELTHVGPGTPCGEYMRRFWLPVAMSLQLGDLPVAIRILGEDLVVFRDRSGRVGLLHRHCAQPARVLWSTGASRNAGSDAATTAGTSTSTGPSSRRRASRPGAPSGTRSSRAPTRPWS